ncbi:MAG: peptidase, partial [bacterium]|nr:peptidase [Candidatus Colousia faecequi]
PRFPIFSGTTKLPAMLGICGQHSDRDDAALTHFRHANRMATVRWGKTRDEIEGAQKYFMDKGMRELKFVEKTWETMSEKERDEMLNGYVSDFFGATVLKWDEFAHKYWRMFWGGF